MSRITIGRARRDRGFSVCRPSPLGNPFRIGSDGDRNEVIRKYQAWFDVAVVHDDRVRAAIEQLTREASARDITLLCYCAPQRCHADVIAVEIRRRIVDST